MRLNKYLSHNSKHSRREADSLIFDGKIMVNGKVITNPAIDVDDRNTIKIRGSYLKANKKTTILVYNKNKGELVSKSDDRGRKTIFDALPQKYAHFNYIGRLDFASEGLLILSDNVSTVSALMSSDISRVYKLKVNGAITQSIIQAMRDGIEIVDSLGGAHKDSDISSMSIKAFESFDVLSSKRNYSKLKVTIKEGQNRELRRFFANFNLDVLDLKRLSFGEFSLNALPDGKYRYATPNEYRFVKNYMASLEL
jgi:23S rRNA pseudouridine2605 synthase